MAEPDLKEIVRLEIMPRGKGYQLVKGVGGAKRVLARFHGGGGALGKAYQEARNLRENGATLDASITLAIGS